MSQFLAVSTFFFPNCLHNLKVKKITGKKKSSPVHFVSRKQDVKETFTTEFTEVDETKRQGMKTSVCFFWQAYQNPKNGQVNHNCTSNVLVRKKVLFLDINSAEKTNTNFRREECLPQENEKSGTEAKSKPNFLNNKFLEMETCKEFWVTARFLSKTCKKSDHS